RLWCWGDDRYGQLGSPATDQPDPTPTLVAALTTPVQLTSAGWLHICAIPVGGTFTCWGDDEHGQLGHGEVQTAQSAPPTLAGTAAGEPSPRHQVGLRRQVLPSEQFLDHASPGAIARAGLASRPAASQAAPRGEGRRSTTQPAALTPFGMMTMNMLGSQ